MCGIIGYVGKKNAINILIQSLERLEYRGYDSAGIAYLTCNRIEIVKATGKIKNLKNKVNSNVTANIGIGHTRWATHGKPNEINAHPHKVGKFTIVHNGIIENYEALKSILIKEGYQFKSETDTEVIAALLDKLYSEKDDILKVLVQLKKLLIGSYALGIMCDDLPNNLYAIRKDNPLIIGIGENEHFIASDVPAILKYTKNYMVISSDEIAKIDDKVVIYNDNLRIVNKKELTFEGNLEAAEKNGFEHFMLKEINEQPTVISNTIKPFLKFGMESLIDNMPDFTKFKEFQIVGCGSAYHAGLIGKSLIEKYCNIPVNVITASEFRYNKIFNNDKVLTIFISQSGETADTLASLRKVKEMGGQTLAIVNIIASSIAREADNVIYTNAGPEISVATTKAYLAQVAILSLIALILGYKKKLITEKNAIEIIKSFETIPNLIKEMINIDYTDIAKVLSKHNVCFYIGRSIDYSLSMEGSLKLKEISYINTICYPAGELKHGTISLVNEGLPIIATITDKNIADKTINNIKEVKARGAFVILIIADNINKNLDFADIIIKIPTTCEFLQNIPAIIAMQLISYETAKLLDRDIDRPKNLAKSVTVE